MHNSKKPNTVAIWSHAERYIGTRSARAYTWALDPESPVRVARTGKQLDLTPHLISLLLQSPLPREARKDCLRAFREMPRVEQQKVLRAVKLTLQQHG